MKNISIGILLAVAALIVGYTYLHSDQQTDTSAQFTTEPVADAISVPQVTIDPVPPVAFTVDQGRLYDPAYETDPELQEYAASIDRTPECVVKAARENFTARDSEDPACYSVSQKSHEIPYTISGLQRMTDEQLKTLALTDANANIVLAQRNADNKQAVTQYIERAMALSGRAGPVQMLAATDDVPREVHALEVVLTSEALGRQVHPSLAAIVRSINDKQAHQLAAERAQERVKRIVTMHKELTGNEWSTS